MSINIKEPDLGPKDFTVADHKHVLRVEEKVNELEKRIEGLYDLFEELVKRLEQQ